MPRTYVFIDSQNLHLGIKGLGWNLDYRRLNFYLKAKYSAIKAIMFMGYVEEYQSLYSHLKSIGFEIVFKNTKRIGTNREDIKGNIDVDLTIETVRRISEYERAIIISADGDFCPLYDYLLENGKSVIIMIPNIKKYSSFLGKYKSALRFMNDLRAKLEEK